MGSSTGNKLGVTPEQALLAESEKTTTQGTLNTVDNPF